MILTVMCKPNITAVSPHRQSIEVQDIFAKYGATYLEQNTPPPHVCKAVRAIINCRTAALGGHVDTCENCGYTHTSYNSCRNRHCPKCQALAKERWVMARTEELLPVPYFHVVFTLPSELDVIVMQNQRIMYDLLLKTSAETLRELAADNKYLGAEIGETSVLHTWSQNLTLHPHVHMIVPGGGLTPDGKWRDSSKKFFIPVKAMSRKFRGKFLFFLRQKKLEFKGLLSHLNDRLQFDILLASLHKKDWYVYCKRPFKTTYSVLEYLGRYTHRIAISNHRIINMDNDLVTFKWRDYRDCSKEKLMTISAFEFIRRFLLHVLPPGFTKIRHYGFLASSVKKQRLELCRKLIGNLISPLPNNNLTTLELIKKLTGINFSICPVCGCSLSRASPDSVTA